ncbi:MAG: bifunctional glutamate N-acetyltransferase/amino-acid acetyltransferase ArgJ [Bacillota bacterium]|nr:bifunctional glutamate N-acetyltransferase/amino-acid acetyltransferase ArgJ [Bacillota bacterium]MDD3298048.1 bifunctional glutamate N-acetyltransferase/amino-acid acetyltransferase ArgJ [Bacillota bacterium]MDD3850497.1 bifunctional glutamate N-acetyltransferase/amino-acid acetyltransferase ArgJ [Bacillota bacterium]MDD4707727.1 bifunctional glutamate N-acetyltransferase/amino-acid acetyltransferase ArgJ [Bacillota bacterium]
MNTEGLNISKEAFYGIKGYKYAGVSCGIKKSGKEDLTLIFSEVPAIAAGVFTTNKSKAAPVLVDLQSIKNPATRAVVINSGNANACTGKRGMDNAKKMVELTADVLGVDKSEVLVSSTGVIGVQLPMEKIETGITKAVSSLSADGGDAAAKGIMTTDTREKKITVKVNLSGQEVTVGAIAKGSGMIHPDMATMLCYMLTDAAVGKGMLQQVLKETVEDTFNMISVDGDTSTNDSVIALANGTAGNVRITEKNEDYTKLLEAFKAAAEAMATEIVRDGEGATKFLKVNVINAPTREDARVGAKAIISSSLVKAAFFGEDANWGRVLCALGYSGADFDPGRVDMQFTSNKGVIWLVKNGEGLDFDEAKAALILSETDIEIVVDLKMGEYGAAAWGCDLSYDYVKINGSYRT